MDQMKAKRDQNEAEMKNILTPAQYQKWEAMKKEKMQERGKMMKGKKMMQMQKTK